MLMLNWLQGQWYDHRTSRLAISRRWKPFSLLLSLLKSLFGDSLPRYKDVRMHYRSTLVLIFWGRGSLIGMRARCARYLRQPLELGQAFGRAGSAGSPHED